jgi:hypothetical protein
MMENDAEQIVTLLMHAHSVEEVFGELAGTREEMFASARKVFRHMAKVLHPDLSHDAAYDEAFKLLLSFWEQARVHIEQGSYGLSYSRRIFEPFDIQTPAHIYHVEGLFGWGDLCSLYAASMSSRSGKSGADEQRRVLLKVTSKPQDNDLVANEVRVLAHLQTAPDYANWRHFASQLVESFSYHERETGVIRQVNVLVYNDGFYSLKEVREAYPQGIDARDMAWMWRRLLVVLAQAHDNAVIHGAVLPTHVLIHPQQHGLVLIDWSYAVVNAQKTSSVIPAISSAYRSWYSPEVFAREVPIPGLDIAMAACCMIDLLGGDAPLRTLPESIPWPLRNHLLGCTLSSSRMRVQDAHLVLSEFDALIERLWGPRVFRKFRMPQR